jgi:hypothetical protein
MMGIFDDVSWFRSLLGIGRNRFQELKFKSFNCTLNIYNNENAFADIEDAWFEPARVKPGESTELVLRLGRFRQEKEHIRVKIDVPDDVKPQVLPVSIFGGSAAPIDYPPPNNAKELVEYMQHEVQNNILTVSIPYESINLGLHGKNVKGLPNSVIASWIPSMVDSASLSSEVRKLEFKTKYVLSGATSATLVIEKKNK